MNTYFITAHDNKALADMRNLMCPKYIDTTIVRDDFKKNIIVNGYDEDIKEILIKPKKVDQNSKIL